MAQSEKSKAQPPQPFVNEVAEADEKRTKEENSKVERDETDSAARRGVMDRIHAPAR